MKTACNKKAQCDIAKYTQPFFASYDHDGRSEEFPAKVPKVVWFSSRHLLDAVAESVGAEEPADGDRLEEHDPHERETRSRVKVHQLEEVNAAFGAHGQAQGEHEDAHADGELTTVFEQRVGPVVDDACDERLHVAKFGVDTENEQHDKEDDGPENRAGQLEHQVRVREENKSGAGVDDIVNRRLLHMSHVAEDGKDEHAGDETRSRVHHARDHGVLVTVVVKLVVGTERGQSAHADAIGKEDLRGAIDPRSSVQ